MTTDQQRKILEHAAKACGLIIVGSTKHNLLIASEGCRQGYLWNPITNSADTAAMCAKLDINHTWNDGYVKCWQWEKPPVRIEHNGAHEVKEAAWRLAASIVAAKIGGYTDE